MATGILSIKLGSALNMPMRRMLALLQSVAWDCNRARNAAMRHWQRWREDNPNWTPGQRRLRNGQPKIKEDGSPVLEHPALSQDAENAMYYAAREAVPALAAKVASACRVEVVQTLKARLPWNHPGRATFRWQGILGYEISAPSFRSLAIPVQNQDVQLMDDEGGVTLRVPVLSQQSGCAVRAILCRLEVRQLSVGNRKLVRNVAAGKIKLADSMLCLRKGKWFFNLTYSVEAVEHNLDATRIATLTAMRADRSAPFELAFPVEVMADGTSRPRAWHLGDAKPLLAEYTRLVIRRKTIQARYRDGAGSGHGRSRFFRATRPYARAFQDMEERFTKLLVADIVRSCLKNDCGIVRYREPTMPLRSLLWFDQQGLPFDWTAFLGRLTFKLAAHSIVLDCPKKRFTVAEHQGEYGWGKGAEAAKEG